MIDLRKPKAEAWPGTEDSLQFECAKWLKKELHLRGEKQLFYHTANERKATINQHSRLKSRGVLAGVPDVILPLRSEEYAGVYCELKRAGGSPSKEQLDFLRGVSNEGYLAIIINDLDTFKQVFSHYLEQRKLK